MLNPDRILVVGDVHGDINFLSAAAEKAQGVGASVILQLGDFGAFWPGSDGWLQRVDRILKRHYIDQLVFIDGNHEGWDTRVGPGGLVGARAKARRIDGFVRTSQRTRWADRGTRWVWGGVRFGALGGAFSIDHWRRRVGKDWWPGLEAPTVADLDTLRAEPLDVLVTHEAPFHTPLLDGAVTPSPADEWNAAQPRRLVTEALRNTGAELLLHGHWHSRLTYETNWWDSGGTEHVARVEAVGCNLDGLADGTLLLDLPAVNPSDAPEASTS